MGMDTGQVPSDVAHKSFGEKQAGSEDMQIMQDALNQWIDQSEHLHAIMDVFHIFPRNISGFPVDFRPL